MPKFRRSICLVPLLLLATVSTGCSLLNDDPESVRPEIGISAASDRLVLGTPLRLTVVAANRGEEPVLLGFGSSSCRLFAVVRVEGGDLPVVPDRICTDDYGPQDLAAGESRVESFLWHGSVYRDDGTEQLEPGTYRVHGKAGPFVGHAFVTIEIEKPQE